MATSITQEGTNQVSHILKLSHKRKNHDHPPCPQRAAVHRASALRAVRVQRDAPQRGHCRGLLLPVRFAQVAYLLLRAPAMCASPSAAPTGPCNRKSPAGYSPREAATDFHVNQNRHQEAKARGETLDNVGRNASIQPQDDAGESGTKFSGRTHRRRQGGRESLPERSDASQILHRLHWPRIRAQRRYHRVHQFLRRRIHRQHGVELPPLPTVETSAR